MREKIENLIKISSPIKLDEPRCLGRSSFRDLLKSKDIMVRMENSADERLIFVQNIIYSSNRIPFPRITFTHVPISQDPVNFDKKCFKTFILISLETSKLA